MSNDVCISPCADRAKMYDLHDLFQKENFQGATTVYKALAEPNRLKIAYSLLLAQELCVCDIANVLEVSVATASHHLRFLSKKGLAKSRKSGKMVYYSLDDDYVKQLVELAFIHRNEGRYVE